MPFRWLYWYYTTKVLYRLWYKVLWGDVIGINNTIDYKRCSCKFVVVAGEKDYIKRIENEEYYEEQFIVSKNKYFFNFYDT